MPESCRNFAYAGTTSKFKVFWLENKCVRNETCLK